MRGVSGSRCKNCGIKTKIEKVTRGPFCVCQRQVLASTGEFSAGLCSSWRTQTAHRPPEKGPRALQTVSTAAALGSRAVRLLLSLLALSDSTLAWRIPMLTMDNFSLRLKKPLQPSTS